MRRYQLVIGGTVAGVAAVLAFPTHRTSLKVPTASASSGSSTTAGGATSSTTVAPTAGGATSSTTSPTATATTRSATSSTQSFRYGDIAVKVTVSGTKITAVKIAAIDETDGRSQQIDQYAVPQLEQQVIATGSANIDGVSGATFTSQAFVDAVASALDKLGISS